MDNMHSLYPMWLSLTLNTNPNCLLPYEYLPIAEHQLLKTSVRTVLEVMLSTLNHKS